MRSSIIGSFPRSFKFTVSGIFELKAEPDQNLALITHNSAQKIKGLGSATENIRLKVNDVMNSRVVGSNIVLESRRRLGTFFHQHPPSTMNPSSPASIRPPSVLYHHHGCSQCQMRCS